MSRDAIGKRLASCYGVVEVAAAVVWRKERKRRHKALCTDLAWYALRYALPSRRFLGLLPGLRQSHMVLAKVRV